MLAQFFLYLWLGFLLGVGFSAFAAIHQYAIHVVVFMAALLLLAFLARRLWLFLALACFVGLFLGNIYSHAYSSDNEYQSFIGQTVDWQGIVAISLEKPERNQRLVIKPDGFSQNLQAFMYHPLYAKVGDRVWLRGQIQELENFSDFDYVTYLHNRKIYAQLKRPKVIVVERSKPSLQSVLTNFRFTLVRRSAELFEGDSGSLIMGMLIGYRKTISAELQEALRLTGTSHIVAVSGFNMTIVAVSCGVFAWYLGRRATLFITIIAVIYFSILTGGQASVVRAAVMALLIVYAQLSGRMYSSSYALVWAAGLMVLHNPKILLGDIGFQLSLSATLGLLIAHQFKSEQAQSLALVDMVRSTLGATIMTAPLIAYHFGVLSVLSLPVNILVLPLVPWVMLLGALSLLPLVGDVFIMLADMLVKLIINIVMKFSMLPFNTMNIELTWQQVLLAYIFILTVVSWQGKAALTNRKN